MDPSATPWRVLEDPADETRDREDAAGLGPGRSSRLRRSSLLTGGLAVLLVIGAFVLAFGSGPSGSVGVEGAVPIQGGVPASSSADPATGTATGRILVVEIVGAVERPGVFRLSAGSRIGDLVSAAGGYGPRVDAGRAGRDLNLAAPLKDGDQVRVPSRDDATLSTPRSTGGPGGTSAGPIDLNHATETELDTLPGIGPVTAAKIVASRDEQPFAAVEDLRTRKLVGEKTFAQLKDLVTVT
ncbi:MAG: ComEA family DNA-binding protein [Chloroflexota bacterium]